LQKLGYGRESIDNVVCTHLHIDHVGWNTMLQNGKWVATFPNARYLIGGTEWDFFSRQEDEFFKAPVDDSVRPIFAEGRANWSTTSARSPTKYGSNRLRDTRRATSPCGFRPRVGMP
jgi:glyoxylase-like metal-dependent hydrolase (beta-lactamase superfamily II)